MKRGGNQTFASPEEALIHFGVKGMRWGVRKEESSGGVVGNASFVGGTMGHGVPLLELQGDDLTVDRSKGYAVFKTADFSSNSAAGRRHAEIIAALDEVRATYPAVAALKIEVVPMSRVPHLARETDSSGACVMAMNRGEARIVYNDKMGEFTPYQAEYLKGWMPGVGTKNYLGYHEMGHVLAVAHGTQPPAKYLMANANTLTIRDANNYGKQNQKNHKKLLKQNGLSYKKIKKMNLGTYSRTMPSEGMAELVGYTLSPTMRSRLDPATLRRTQAMIDQMGGRR